MSELKLSTLLLTFLALVVAPQATPELQPDLEVQSALERLATAATPEEQTRALDLLLANAGTQHERLVPQLLLFSESSTSTREGMLFGAVVERFAIPPSHVIDALVPLLESADATRRASIGGVLAAYEARSMDRPANFDAYDRFLRDGEPLGLVRYLYETDANAALSSMIRSTVTDGAQLRALRLAQHDLADLLWKLEFRYLDRTELPAAASPDSIDALTTLAGSDRWWARLAAAHAAADYPELASVSGVAALSEDAHPLVREVATR